MKKIRQAINKACIIAVNFYVLFFLLACQEGDDGETSAVITGIAQNICSFQAEVCGTINDDQIIQSINRGKGTIGMIYVTETEGSADGMFSEYQSSGLTENLHFANSNSISPDGSFSVVITGLSAGQTVFYCAYTETQDGERQIGTANSFKTKTFEPEAITGETSAIGFYKATLHSNITIDENDQKYCTLGIIFSESPNVTATQGNIRAVTNLTSEGAITLSLANLSFETTYYYRAFVKENSSGNFHYGQEKSFTTMGTDEMSVDLGLSVKWASCDLGTEYYRDNGGCYTWGDTKSTTSFSIEKYKFYNASLNSYDNIGQNICGTEYDAATALLGGKWRMPTIDEVKELYNNCSVRTIEWTENDTTKINGSTIVSIVTKHSYIFNAKNGNEIAWKNYTTGYASAESLGYTTLYWTGNGCSENSDKAYCTEIFPAYTTDNIVIADRAAALPIRPVCEY